ncbi:MAG: cyclic nucleotide-binding domain-containing protein [Deltaproteobacteria bacterium]|nr:cyclic nucleotide-binding domain-containing protein [Deltaproteobacteria bacterium]
MSESQLRLADHPFFKDLNPQEVEKFTHCAHSISLGAGDYLFREGGDADRLFLVQEGKVALELDVPGKHPITILTVEGGGVVGWSWLFPPHRWYLAAKATVPTRLVALDAKSLMNEFEKNPSVGLELMKRVANIIFQRLQAVGMQFLSVAGKV